MGGRLLRRWIGQPLTNLPALLERQEAVAALYAATPVRVGLMPLRVAGGSGTMACLMRESTSRQGSRGEGYPPHPPPPLSPRHRGRLALLP